MPVVHLPFNSISPSWKEKYSGTSIFSSFLFRTCATCLQAQGSPPCVPAHAHHMVTCALCQADLLIAWGQGESLHREGRCITKRLAAVTYLFISSFRLPVLSRRRRKGLGIVQAVSWTQSVSYNYHHSFFSFFLFFGSPGFIILRLGEWGKGL